MSETRVALMRYQIADEPQQRMWTRIVIPPFFLFPLTVYFALSTSPLFFLLPALNALLVNGNHRWRDIGLSVLTLVLFMIGIIILSTLEEAGTISREAGELWFCAVLAISVAPLLKVLADQEMTMVLRADMRA